MLWGWSVCLRPLVAQLVKTNIWTSVSFLATEKASRTMYRRKESMATCITYSNKVGQCESVAGAGLQLTIIPVLKTFTRSFLIYRGRGGGWCVLVTGFSKMEVLLPWMWLYTRAQYFSFPSFPIQTSFGKFEVLPIKKRRTEYQTQFAFQSTALNTSEEEAGGMPGARPSTQPDRWRRGQGLPCTGLFTNHRLSSFASASSSWRYSRMTSTFSEE